jgi:phosphoglycerate dehydrogenase-like enzyme
VQEAEKIEALQARPDLQAVLDVTDPEPPAPDSPLYTSPTLPNVFLLTPHLSGSTGRECRRLGRYGVDQVEKYPAGGDPQDRQMTREQARVMA